MQTLYAGSYIVFLKHGDRKKWKIFKERKPGYMSNGTWINQWWGKRQKECTHSLSHTHTSLPHPHRDTQKAIMVFKRMIIRVARWMRVNRKAAHSSAITMMRILTPHSRINHVTTFDKCFVWPLCKYLANILVHFTNVWLIKKALF